MSSGRHEYSKGEEDRKPTRLSGISYVIIAIMSSVGILLCVNQIFYLQIGGFSPIGNAYYYYILAVYLSMSFLIFPARNKDMNRIPWYDWFLFSICMVLNSYLALNAYNILTKGWEYTAPIHPTIAGGMLWFLALEGARRAAGLSLFAICLLFSLYPLYAGYMPGFLWGNTLSFPETMRYHSMGVESIIGIPTRVVGDLIIGFIMFGVALVSSGGGKFFMDFALSLLGHTRGGAAKVSVFSSSLMASLSGSVISNIITTGSVTIPTMKNTGYSPRYAAAIEACASTGGSIMPPVMGAAGFLIASFLNTSYSMVMLAAFFPAFLYYFTLLLQVDAHAAKAKIGGLPKNQLPNLWTTLKSGWFFFGSLLLLIFILLYLRIESWAPFYTMLFLFFCAMIRKETRYTWRKFIRFIVESGRLLSNIVAILAGIGLIIGSLSVTGVANSFSRELVLLAGGNYILLLIFGAITSFILGIGMTVTACYVFLAIVLVPALVETGLDPLACHMFVLYWGCLSYITPPVALGSITAAAIAGSEPMRTGFLSMKLGSAKYIVPFFFVLDSSMILSGSLSKLILVIPTALLGCVFLASALEGHLYSIGSISPSARFMTLASGILLLHPSIISDMIGITLVGLLFITLRIYPDLVRISKPEPAIEL